ncbi:endonuclease domain-containing protein, partial [Escherichia coli]|uniref:endonuclease domain-containing protein n=1 Tax=Escherichia coli TaxID=562 RepID=UPI0034D65C21
MPIDRFVVDFLCVEAGLVVEIDGRQHEALASYDAERSRIIRGYGFEVVRFTNREIMEHPALALARLRSVVD